METAQAAVLEAEEMAQMVPARSVVLELQGKETQVVQAITAAHRLLLVAAVAVLELLAHLALLLWLALGDLVQHRR